MTLSIGHKASNQPTRWREWLNLAAAPELGRYIALRCPRLRQSAPNELPSPGARVRDPQQHSQSTASASTNRSQTIPPLPGGEGRGEGERNTDISPLSPTSREHPTTNLQTGACELGASLELKKRSQQAFSLIELILVMMLLVIIVSLVTPKLREFFQGRALDSEVRRFVTMTRYAQSRAVSEGVPMILWVDTKARTYGVKQETGYTDGDSRPETFYVAEDLKINLGKVPSRKSRSSKLTGIHFSPDGNAVTNTSVSGVSFQVGRTAPVWIMPSANGLTYEVQTDKAKIASLRR